MATRELTPPFLTGLRASRNRNLLIRNIPVERKPSGGGAAAAAGLGFQARVAAWFAVQILAEADVPPPWRLARHVRMSALSSETANPVDDLLIQTSEGGFIFVQVKTGLRVSPDPQGGLAGSFQQFVQQYLSGRRNRSLPPARPLDAQRDRLVLVSGASSSDATHRVLTRALERLQHTPGSMSSRSGNQKEQSAVDVLAHTIDAAWRAAGHLPGAEEATDFLSLIRFTRLNLDPDGTDRTAALSVLRTSVLDDETQDEFAWNTLAVAGSRFAEQRSGGDREELQRLLISDGCRLKAPRSFRSDIERLRLHSRRAALRLGSTTQIAMASGQVHLHRDDAGRILDLAGNGSVLVTGQPGIGKSSALSGFIDLAENSGADAVVLNAGDLNSATLGGLRTELGLQHDVEEVLENWPGPRGYLVIDALDAARGDAAARTLRDLIAGVIQAGGRWTVVASIREFDLRYSPELQRLFHDGPSNESQSRGFPGRSRAVSVGPLSDSELDQLKELAPQLHAFVNTAPSEVRLLIRVPFNLRLAADLLAAGVHASELRHVRTQLDLLDRYWRARVYAGDRLGAVSQREEVLRRLCNVMVEDRSLRVPKHRLLAAELQSAEPMEELLRAHVLTEWHPSIDSVIDPPLIAFSHHILFDYAVARLIVRDSSSGLPSILARDPEFAVIVRPSLVLHFHHLWGESAARDVFWNTVLGVLAGQDVPQIGKIIGPGVAAELADDVNDFDPLVHALNGSPERVATAEEALRHVVGALVARAGDSAPPPNPAWAGLAERISRNLTRPVAGTLRVLLSFVAAHADHWDPSAMSDAGQAARRLLSFAWDSEPYHNWLATAGIELVSWTFSSDPAASASLLRRGLGLEHLRLHGAEEMRVYADQVARLAQLDPELTAEIYEAAFGYVEQSEETTTFGGGPVMSFTGTRRQDYRMAQYSLAKAYPGFLQRAPEHATRALVRAVAGRFDSEYDGAKLENETIEFRGQRVKLVMDRSNVWARYHRRHEDDLHDMLEDFENFLTLAERAVVERIVGVVLQENRLAIFWAHLLEAGARAPDTVGQFLLSLGWSRPLLAADETVQEAARFLAEVFPRIADEDRLRIEHAILSLPDLSAENHAWLERRRNRLIASVEPTLLRSPEAIALAARLNAADPGEIETEDPYPGVYSGAFGTRDFLALQGVDVDQPSSQKVLAETEPLATFNSEYLNTEPPADALRAAIPLARRLHAVVTTDSDGIHPAQVAYAWGVLASTAETCAKATALPCDAPDGTFVRDLLLAAMERPEPAPDPEGDASFDRHPSWGSPSSRIEAAQGVIALARKEGCASPEVLAAVERLSSDPSPAVRYQIATRAVWLFSADPDRMWRIVERMSAEEPSTGVLQGLLAGALDPLAGHSADRVANFLGTILRRVRDGDGAAEVRGRCVGTLTRQALWLGNTVAASTIETLMERVGEHADELARVKPVLRHVLIHGAVDPSDPAADRIRRRGIDFVSELTRRSASAFQSAISRVEDGDDATTPARDESVQNLAQLLDGIAFEIYLASGAHDDPDPDPEEPMPDLAQRRRFYHEIGPVIDDLAEVGLAPLAHHLLEALEAFVPFDPRGVFVRVNRVVQGGKKGNYPHDSLAQRTVIGLVERYLADYREVFREHAECRAALVSILDVFVEVGWPRARQLTYRLEEIFR